LAISTLRDYLNLLRVRNSTCNTVKRSFAAITKGDCRYLIASSRSDPTPCNRISNLAT
jgi:hypothetical protein